MGNDLQAFEISVAATIALGTDQHSGSIRNLSAHGAMFEALCPLEVGENLFLQIEGCGWIYATVAWAMSPRFGLSFHNPIANGKLSFLRDKQLLSILQFEQLSASIVRPSEEDISRQIANGF